MKTIKLNVPLLIGDTHRDEGYTFDADPVLAKRLTESGHASVYDAPTPPEPPLETASLATSPRKAARLSGRAE